METLVILIIIFSLISCIGMGLIFKKMNLGFIKGIIPFYNKMILINKYTIPPYHFILMFIPIAMMYTNYKIYKKICEEYNKDSLYVIELTLFPFVYNFFLGVELEQAKIPKKEVKKKENKIEKQEKEEKEEQEDEYVWHPKEKFKNNTVYKATRNDLNTSINIDNEIIEDKVKIRKTKENERRCPNCNAKVSKNAEICQVCGTKL